MYAEGYLWTLRLCVNQNSLQTLSCFVSAKGLQSVHSLEKGVSSVYGTLRSLIIQIESPTPYTLTDCRCILVQSGAGQHLIGATGRLQGSENFEWWSDDIVDSCVHFTAITTSIPLWLSILWSSVWAAMQITLKSTEWFQYGIDEGSLLICTSSTQIHMFANQIGMWPVCSIHFPTSKKRWTQYLSILFFISLRYNNCLDWWLYYSISNAMHINLVGGWHVTNRSGLIPPHLCPELHSNKLF